MRPRLPFSPSLCLVLLLSAPAPAATPDPTATPRTLLATAESPTAPLAARARALQQLALVASADAVPALAALLTDEKLGHYARDVLEQIPHVDADTALLAALPRLTGDAQLGVINSLGLRRTARAVDPLNVLTISDHAPTTAPALLALGRIATPSALAYLTPSLTRKSPAVRAAAAEGLILAAERLVLEGHRSAALPLYHAVRRADLPAPLRLTATRGAILADVTAGLPLLLELLRSPELDTRDLALLTLRDVRGPKITAAFLAEINGLPAPTQTLALAALAPPTTEPPVPTVPVSLFNGRDLAHWDGDPTVWRVVDGVIVGGSLAGNPRNEFLTTLRPYKNFILRLDYRLIGTKGFVNGGVQFRSVRIDQPPNEMSGYQADIGAGHSGCLYDESRRKKFLARATDEQIKRLEKPGEWNAYEIRCEGPKITLTLNGETTVTYIEANKTIEPDGLIALQIHGNCSAEISFRHLTLEALP
jgi:hypothetical protein